MDGTQGIAPDGTRYLLCGLSYRQILSVTGEGVTMKDAADRLGVAYDHFRRKMHRLGLSHWWPHVHYSRPKSITAADIEQLASEGYSQKDAAFMAGVSYSYFKSLVREYELNSLFPNCGKASWISRKGYAE